MTFRPARLPSSSRNAFACFRILYAASVAGIAPSALAASPFTIAVLPDTQYYSQNNIANPNSSLFHDQVDWLLGHRESLNLKFVTHLGDVVNVAGAAGSASGQWAVAQSAMARLKDSTLPFNILPGNHDWTSTAGTGSIEHYRSRFGDQANYFQGKSWFLGYDPRGVNSAALFDTPAGPMLNISLEFNATSPTSINGAPSSPIAWAQSVINANKGVPTIISTHNAINPGSGRDGFGQSLFKQLVRDNNQVFMVLNGHYTGNDNEQDLTSLNSYGRVVFERGVDYQNNANGGDGWMNLIEFDPDAKKIRLATYSPKNNADLSGDSGGVAGPRFGNSGTIRTDYDSQFERDFDFAKRFSPTSVKPRTRSLSFQQGVNGYAGATDTKIDQVNATASYGATNTFDVDGETTVDNVSQSLIKFGDLFGSGTGQVAPDRDVQRATLRLYVDAGVSNSQGSGLLAHRMLTDWNGGSTWTTLEAGVSPNGLEAAYGEEDSAGASTGGENVKQGSWIELDVTDSLRAMRHGAPNFGWALLPWSGGSNAVIINSSDSSNASTRPQLVVDVTQDPVVARSFKNGLNGYAAAKDTWIDQASPAATHASDPTLRADAGTTDYTSPDVQALLRFDGLIGSDSTQIPEDDVRVTSAMLILNVSSDANAEGSGVVIHRMTSDWSDTATWNTLGGGVVPGRDATTTPDETLGEDANVVALRAGRVYADVTASLRAWTEEGEANLGFGILPTVRGTNAVFFDSSESAIANRPELVVRYQSLAPATWNRTGDGLWSSESSWANGEVPHAVGRTVVFGNANLAPTRVSVDDDRTIGTLQFDSLQPYTLEGAGSLTLQRLSGTGRVQVLRGDHRIDLNVTLKGNAEITVAAGATLSLTGQISTDATGTLEKYGNGLLSVSTVHFQLISLHEGTLSLQGGTSVVKDLEMGAEGDLALSDGSMLIDYTTASPYATWVDWILGGRVRPDATHSQLAIAIVEADEVTSFNALTGINADISSLWVTGALGGDVDLSGDVDFADLLTLAQSYGASVGRSWTHGDFNYDGVVGFEDLLTLAQNYGARSELTPDVLPGNISNTFLSDWALAQAQVPEPASAVFIATLVSVAGRRRRS
jgi:hypothetical protein